MLYRLTEGAKQVLYFARYEAFNYGDSFIEPEHLLLAITRQKIGIIRDIMVSFNIDPNELRSELEFLKPPSRSRKVEFSELSFSSNTHRVLKYAEEEANKLSSPEVGVEHLLLGILRHRATIASEILQSFGLTLERLRYFLDESYEGEPEIKETLYIEEFARDLTRMAKEGKLDPVIGRDAEIEKIIQILARRKKNNPVLVGEPGVGKTAIVEGLAQRIVRREVPPFLRGKRILALDLAAIVAGTKYRGQFEERMKEIIYDLKEHPEIILFIDEVHNLVGAGSAEGALDAASILKPALSRGEIQIIGATTPDEYRKCIESDRALERRFQKVYVKDPSPEEVKKILLGLKDRYERFHGISYTDEAIEYSVKLADRYISERSFPDKALDIMDEAGARAKIAGKQVVGKKEVEEVVSLWTGIPLPQLDEGEEKRIVSLEKRLRRYVLAQDEAITKVVSAIKRARAGMKPGNRPWGVFLFLGPTGVGKTHLAKMLAKFLMGSENKLLRFDMSEYKEEHTISRLVGSPPGYVGYKEGGQLTEKVKNNPYSVILFDEIEKAHPSIYQLLLQVFDDGRLTDAMGRTVDFRNTIIVMTSNLGSRSFTEERRIGFAGEEKKAKEDRIMEEVRRHFPPEFLNRIDEIVIFNPLDEKTLKNILLLYQEEINEQAREYGWQLRLLPSVLDLILKATEKERHYGARPLRRALESMVLDPLSNYLFKRKRRGILVEVYARNGKVHFRTKSLKESVLTGR